MIDTTVSTGLARTVAAHGLTKRYGARRAVDDLHLEINGGVVGLLGPNGAGKTTLLRMLATVLAPDSGRVTMLGRDPAVPAERLEIRRRLGYLPQSPQLYPSFTPLELVDYVAILKEHSDREWRREEGVRVLEAVGLTDLMHRRIKTLSGGMRQRVALASALLGSPELLVLDEPATGLDPEQRLELRSLLAGTARRGTVVLSTHNTTEVSALCQHVVVLRSGRVLFTGTPAGLSAVAAGRVWEDDDQNPAARRSWMTADGTWRHLGDPPAGAAVSAPTIDDGYLYLAMADRGPR
jgi:ABC-2 type transport system ATP-binding protein